LLGEARFAAAQGLGGAVALRHVGESPGAAHDGAVLAPGHLHVRFQPPLAAVLGDAADLVDGGAAALGGALDEGAVPGAVVRMHVVKMRPSQALRYRVAHDPGPGRIEERESPVAVGLEDHLLHRGHEVGVARLALAARLGGRAPVYLAAQLRRPPHGNHCKDDAENDQNGEELVELVGFMTLAERVKALEAIEHHGCARGKRGERDDGDRLQPEGEPVYPRLHMPTRRYSVRVRRRRGGTLPRPLHRLNANGLSMRWKA
jgi:hypothetical protein